MKNYFLIAAFIIMGLSLESCKEKKNDEPNHFEGIYYDENSSDREYIEKVATAFLGFVKPGEQSEAIKALNTFSSLCDEYAFPDNFYDTPSAPAARELSKAIEDNDFLSLSRAVNAFVYNISRFKGMYQATPDSYVWRKIEDRDDVMFRYWMGGTQYDLTVSGLGASWTASVTDEGNEYKIEVPRSLDFMLTRGSSNTSTIISSKIQTEVSDGASLYANTSTRLGSYQIDLITNGKGGKITEEITLYHHDPSSKVRTLMLSSSAEINGSNLCSLQAWKEATDNGSLETMIASMSSTVMIYRSLQIKAKVNNVNTFVNNVDEVWTSYDTADPRAMAQKAASDLKSSVTAEVRYCGDNPDRLRGTLGWEPYLTDDRADYQEWEVRPTITFAKDNVTHDFGSYFGNGQFLSVENSIKNILKTYKSYWK